MILLQAAEAAKAAQPINVLSVVLTIFGSGVVAAIANHFFNLRMKNAEFEYDYRKHILEKRKAAYEKIEEMMNIVRDEKGIHKLFTPDMRITGQEEINNNSRLIREVVAAHNIWYSPDLIKACDRVCNALIHIRVQSGKQENDFEEMKIIQSWSASFKELKAVYFHDIVRLSDVDSFIKAKKEEDLPKITRL